MDTKTITDKLSNYKPVLAFYHPNPKGTGVALQFQLFPAKGADTGYILVKMAKQKTVPSRLVHGCTFPTFDWDNQLEARFGFEDLAMMLQVLRGECEDMGSERGIFKRDAKGSNIIKFRHAIEPAPHYELEFNYKPAKGEGGEEPEEVRALALLSCAEAVGLEEAIKGSMWLVAFGVPAVQG